VVKIKIDGLQRGGKVAEISLKINGMSCQHCVMNVKKALDGIDGVRSSDVTVGFARVIYDEAKTNQTEISQAVQKTGYKTAP
jgi:copper chaperone CopZ